MLQCMLQVLCSVKFLSKNAIFDRAAAFESTKSRRKSIYLGMDPFSFLAA